MITLKRAKMDALFEYDFIYGVFENRICKHIGFPRTIEDYKSECLHGENECAELIAKYEHSKTRKDIIVWYDSELDETYITY